MSIIEVKNLNYIYGSGTPFEKNAIKNLNLKIEDNQIIGVIGHTGSGKSTLMQLLNGLLKPTSGEILFLGKNIWENPKKIRNIRFNIGLVFQYPEHQLFDETVEADISFGPKNMGLSSEEISLRVKKAAEFSGISEKLLKKSPFDLSGGEKRRAAIAGVIAMEPRVLVLDEPTAGLDPLGKDSILNSIVNYQKTNKNCVIIVSHSMEDIANIADKILVLNQGEAVLFDDCKGIFSKSEELERVGLKIPQITKLINILRKNGFPLSDEIFTVESAYRAIMEYLKKEEKL